MPWQPEDWDALLRQDEQTPTGGSPLVRALHGILTRIPGRARMEIADVGKRPNVEGLCLDSHFASIVAVPAERDALDGLAERFDVALAIDVFNGWRAVEVDDLLEGLRGSLVEGGVLLANFPGIPRKGPVRAFQISSRDARGGSMRFHEVELQYRLTRAGFQGLRVRRFRCHDGGSETLLCMAVRRANN